MVTQKQLLKLNDTLAELIKDRKKLQEEMQQKNISLGRTVEKVYVRTLYDGYDNLTDFFTGESMERYEQYGNHVRFERLPVNQSMCSDVPLLIVSDESEVDQESSQRLYNRQKVGAPTFPVIVFPDDYFKIRKGESLAYTSICDSLKDASECSIMPFRKRDINEQPAVVRLFVSYICEAVFLWGMKRELVSFLSRLEEECSWLDEEYRKIREMYDQKQKDESADRLLEWAAAWIYLKFLVERCEWSRERLERIDTLSDRLSGFENFLREEYDKHILALRTHANEEETSGFSIKLKLTYGILNENLEDLCRQAEKELKWDKLAYPLEQTVDFTCRAIGTNAADIAFIGTFSSGKTTLINTLLGHRHKLRTSGKHNTAVLMKLFAAESEEHYEILYKKELKWDIIRSNTFTSKNIVNEFDCSAKVISIRKSSAGGSIIQYRSDKTGEVREADVGSGHMLAVREGMPLAPRASLVAIDTDRNVFRLCSRAELDYLEKLMKSGKVSGVCLMHADGETAGTGVIRKLISLIRPLYENIKDDNARPSVKREDLEQILGKGVGRYHIATFFCRLTGFKDRVYRLDEAGWQKFAGDGDGRFTPFSESPECYMPAREVKLYLNSEFLKYCSITDTPGFGSITDEHDAITERYLRDSHGKLVVMITVNTHTFDKKFDDLIRSIASVFRNYRPDQMKDVSFVLNCFTSTLPMEQCRISVRKVVEYIRDFGFTENDIYVDNLKEVLERNTDKKVFVSPYPAYPLFKENCLSRFLTEAICRKYEEVQKRWDAFFSENRNWIENQINQYSKDLRNQAKREDELTRAIRQVESVELPSIEFLLKDIKKEFKDAYNRFEQEFEGNRKGIFTHHRQKAIKSVLEDEFKPAIACWEDEEAGLVEKIAHAMNMLYFYAKMSDVPEVVYPNGRMVVATFEKIRSLLLEADSETHFYNKSKKTNYYMERLHKLMKQDSEQSRCNVQDYYDRCRVQLNERKNFITKQMKEELSNIKNAGSLEKSIREYQMFQDVLTAFKKQIYDRISFKL